MTTDEILANAKKLRDVIGPLPRSKQVVWFGDTLGVDRAKLLRLLGYTPKTISKRLASGASFEELAEARPDETLWVSELFRELANSSGYDLDRMRDRLTTPLPDEPPAGRAGVGRLGVPRAARSTPARQVAAIWEGGPDVVRRFADYLRPAAPRPRV